MTDAERDRLAGGARHEGRLHPLTQRFGAALALCAALALQAGTVVAQEVIPDFYKEPGLNPNRSYVNQNFNEHIDPFTGSLQLHYVDLHLPGNGGFDLSVVRSYNSTAITYLNPAASYDSVAGLGWNVHFGRLLKKDTSICATGATSVANNPVVELPDGTRQLLAFTGGTAPLALSSQRWRADCYGAGAGMSVYSPDGTRYDMNQLVNITIGTAQMYAWYTTRITDRNGNFATINYAGSFSPEITSVTTNDGRSISFSYLNPGTLSRRISSITAAGATYNYGYTAIPNVTGKYQLTSVTRPGGTSWGYAYNGDLAGAAGGYLMNRVTYPEGGSITYAYDFVYFDTQANPNSRSTVVKTKSLSSGGTWSFTYTPGAFNVYDTTTVSTPSGTITYKHIGPNYTSSGTVWMVGLLMSKQTGSVQTETNVWGKQKISSQNNFRPGAFATKVDAGEYNAPVLNSRTIVRNGATYSTSYSGFDTYGNPATVVESGPNGGNRTTSLTHFINTTKWIVKQVKDETVASGVSITRSFDTNGNLLSTTRDGVMTSHLYDAQGNITSTTFPRSLTHTYSNYKRGIAQNESQPEGVSLTRVVSDAGNVTSETNGELKTTGYGYDGLNRVTSITPPQGSAVSISYGTTSKTATRGSLTETTTYDGFGRPSAITLGGVTRSYQHDALGRMTFASNPGAGIGTGYQYDILDRVTQITNPGGTSQTITYGAGSKTVSDERAKATTYTYRGYGDPEQQLLMGVSSPEPSASITIGRNTKDLVTSMLQDGVSRTFGYNTAGYLTSVVNPETGTTTYGRDAAGNMTSRSVGASGTTTYVHDGQNRLTTATYPGATPAVTNTYSRTHKLKSVSSTAASRSYIYDNNDNLTSESLTVDGITLTTGYGYNSLDQLSSITYPRSNRVVNYAPNALGRPTQVSGFVTSVAYWPSGQVQQINYTNGTVSNYGQNSRLWPASFTTSRGASTWVNSSYAYDGAGNLTNVTDSADSGYNRTLGYDNINRLTSASGPWGAGSIAYNGRGNITSQSIGSFALSYAYDGQNRLSSVSGARAGSFTYDAYGDVVSAPAGPGALNTFAYDGVPNLTCVNCADSTKKVAYTYDGQGRRVTVTKGTTKTYEVYGSHGNLLLEYTPSQGMKTVEYIYLGGKRIAQVQSDNISTTSLTATPNPVAAGQQVTLRATVNGTSPTGSVTFRDGATTLGNATLSAGVATLLHTFSTVGARSLTAVYGGDANNGTSTSSPVSLNVTSVSGSTTTLTVTPNPAIANQTVTLTANVTGSSPTGTVTFRDGATVLATVALSAARATHARVFSVGSHSITASYSGDANNGTSASSPVSLNVTSVGGSTTALSVAPNPAVANQSVTLTANVNGSNPTGTVTFRDGATVLATVALSAARATHAGVFAAGSHSITASYSGDANNGVSTSPATVLNVSASTSTTTTLTASPNPSTTSQAVVLTANVSGSSPTGTVTFRDGTATLGTATVSAGRATLNTTFTTAGSHSLTASYGGDTYNGASTSAALTQTVIAMRASTTTLTTSKAVASRNEGVVFTATVSGSSPTGQVTFYQGNIPWGTVALSGGRAVWNGSFGAIGRYPIRAEYLGDTTHTASTSATLQQRIYEVDVQALPVLVGTQTTFYLTLRSPYTTGQVWFVDKSNNMTVVYGAFSGSFFSGSYTFPTFGTRSIDTTVSVQEPEGIHTWKLPLFDAHVVGMNWRSPPASSVPANSDFWVRVNISGNTSSGGRVDVTDNGTVVGSFPLTPSSGCLEHNGANWVRYDYTFCGAVRFPSTGSRSVQVQYHAPGLAVPATLNTSVLVQ